MPEQNNRDEVIPVQLSLLRDTQDQTLQTRFEKFCNDAADRLMEKNANGDPLFVAGSAKATFSVKVTVERTANDAFNFSFSNEISSTMPQIPGKMRSSVYHRGKGLVQRAVLDAHQLSLLNPDEGQPVAMDDAGVRQTLPPE